MMTMLNQFEKMVDNNWSCLRKTCWHLNIWTKNDKVSRNYFVSCEIFSFILYIDIFILHNLYQSCQQKLQNTKLNRRPKFNQKQNMKRWMRSKKLQRETTTRNCKVSSKRKNTAEQSSDINLSAWTGANFPNQQYLLNLTSKLHS